MPERCSGLTLNSPCPFCLAVFMEQLTTLSVELGDKDSAARSLAALKSELAEEKAQAEAEAEAETLARAVRDVKKTTDKFAAHVRD
jgi:hypothetical protein